MPRIGPGVRLVEVLSRTEAGAPPAGAPDGGLLAGRPRRGVRIGGASFQAPHGGQLPLRTYTPVRRGRDRPVVVAFHGGGLTAGSARQNDWTYSRIAHGLDAVVVAVDYRLAPAHPFPAGLEDCFATVRWVASHGGQLGADTTRLAVVGDSVGGNLAAVVALMARNAGGPRIAHQALLYPVTDLTDGLRETASYRRNTRPIVVGHAELDTFHRHYLRNAAEAADWWASPLLAPDLRGLPPAVVVVGGLDPLHDSGLAYASALRAAGVAVTVADYPSAPHGFVNFPYLVPAARSALAAVTRAQRAALRGGASNHA